MKEKTKYSLGAKAALFGAAIIWGSSFFIMKNAVEVLPTNLLLGIRFLTGCLLLSLIFHKRLKKLNKSYFLYGFIIGLFLYLAYWFQTVGLRGTTPGKNAFLTAIYCILVPFLFWIINKSKPSIYNYLAAFVCVLGIGFVTLNGDFSVSFGDFMTLIGGFFFASHMVAVAKLVKDKDPIVITILQFGFFAIISWIMFFFTEELPSANIWDVGVILELFYLAFFATTAALLLQNIGQTYTHPSAAAIILSLEAVLGVVFSIIFYGESLTLKLAIGFILIFISIIISETKLSFLKSKNPLKK